MDAGEDGPDDEEEEDEWIEVVAETDMMRSFFFYAGWTPPVPVFPVRRDFLGGLPERTFETR